MSFRLTFSKMSEARAVAQCEELPTPTRHFLGSDLHHGSDFLSFGGHRLPTARYEHVRPLVPEATSCGPVAPRPLVGRNSREWLGAIRIQWGLQPISRLLKNYS